MAENDATLETKITEDAAAVAAKAQAELSKQIEDLKGQLLTSSNIAAAVREATESRVAPVAQNAISEEQFASAIDEAIEKSGGKVSAGVIKAFKDAVPAIVGSQAATGANVMKQLAANDPQLRDHKGTSLMTRFDKEIRAYIKQNGITDQYLSTQGYGDIVTLIAARDSGYQAERKQAVIDEYKTAQEKAANDKEKTRGGAGPVVEGVALANVSPAPVNQTEDQAIAAIKVSPEQEGLLYRRYRLSKADIQRQKHEMAQLEEHYGAEGLRQIGGYPVCSLSTVPIEKLPEGVTRKPRTVMLMDAEDM